MRLRPRRLPSAVAAALVALPLVVASLHARAASDEWEEGTFTPPAPPAFQLEPGLPQGGAVAAAATPAYLAGSRIAALADGALVIDADSGALIRTDLATAPVAQVAIGRDAGVLAYDPAARLAYVADRRGDRIVAVRVGLDGSGLAIVASWATPAEPYGLALAPDLRTLLVATVADRVLVAYDVSASAAVTERWRLPLAREPRGVAIAPDGTRALVAHLGAGVVDDIDLRASPPRAATPRAVAPGQVRGSFAVQFLGAREAVVPFQRSVTENHDERRRDDSHYGGSESAPPITDHLAFVGLSGSRTASVAAQIATKEPRALAWDDTRDALYIAGMGTDTLVQIQRASQVDPAAGATTALGVGGEACGPDGVAIAAHGDVLVWCSFSRRVERIAGADAHAKQTALTAGPALAPSALAPAPHAGLVGFYRATARVSSNGGVACASCHVEGRADGLSWQIESRTLQTPMLAGRLVGTGPFKWDGGAHDLRTSIGATTERLGGTGLSPASTVQLVAYLEQLPPVRTPTRPREEVARGRVLFESASLGCANCHDGAAYTDQSKHRLAGTLRDVDTPSLLGLAASAPYFHDGSAPTLEALLRDRGGVHGMADTARQLDDAQVHDLTAFLETL